MSPEGSGKLVRKAAGTSDERSRDDETFRQLFETIHYGYYRTSLEGNFVLLNPTAVRLLGYKDEKELLGKPAKAHYTNPQDRERLLDTLKKQNGVVTDYEIELVRPGGETFFAQLNARYAFDEKGEPVGLHGVVRDVTEHKRAEEQLESSHLKHGVEVVRDYEEVPRILCLPDELNQVWTNLIHNSLQAMDNKGTLEIGVSKRDGSIAVSVTDSGPGIPDDVREKIFEPFFTTKPAGEGTGLGLDIVKKIVDKHGGRIEVDSKPGRTTMCVILPMRTRGAKEA